MSINTLTRWSFVFSVGLALGAASALAAEPSAVKDAKISMSEARQIALKTYPGKIMKQELEREAGGLRYSFDIRQGRKWREIGVDARTGQILENKAEHANPRD